MLTAQPGRTVRRTTDDLIRPLAQAGRATRRELALPIFASDPLSSEPRVFLSSVPYHLP